MANSKKAKSGAIWLTIGCVVAVALTVWVIFSGVTGVSKLLNSKELASSFADTFNKTVSGVNEEDLAKIRYVEIFNDTQSGTYSVAYGLDDLMAVLESDDAEADPTPYYHTVYVDGDYDFSDFKYLTGLKNAVVYLAEGFDMDNFAASAQTLESLGYYYCAPADISKVSNFTALKEAGFTGSNIEDVSVFAALTNLEGLYLEGGTIKDVTPLVALTNLKELSLTSNEIEDISSLGALTNLELLALSANKITDASVVASLPELKTIALENNSISDVSAFTALNTEKVENLYLTGNPIEDLSALDYLGDKLVFEVAEETTETTEDTQGLEVADGYEVGEDGSVTLTGDALQQFLDEQGVEGAVAAE